MAGDDPFVGWSQDVRRRVENALDANLPAAHEEPVRLHRAMRYAVADGKRIRSLLCQAAGELADGAVAEALDVASAALEMIHASSLVHDDLPSMDNDSLRRGKPTVHIQYDEATAVLVGDALQAQAYLALSAFSFLPEQSQAIVHELALASGSTGMAGGQAFDLLNSEIGLSRAALEQTAQKKTASLFVAAARIGMLCGKAKPTESVEWQALNAFADAIGLAYQVVDDIDDAATDMRVSADDSRVERATFVSILGLVASQELIRQLRTRAIRALEPLGSRAQMLYKIADVIVPSRL